MEPEQNQRNILLTLAFDGTAYHGWQVQENAVTVQQTLQDAMEAVLKTRPPVKGCSRTDSGVHAYMYCCSFKTSSAIPCDSLRRALNVNLPYDISVTDCNEVAPDFHARYSCTGKEYIYKIWNSENRDPFLNGYAYFYPKRLELERMRQAAAAFIGRHDFRGFCASGSDVGHTVREVSRFEIERDGCLVTMRVRADGFLYNMVRIMTGTLLHVSRGRISPGELPAIIESGSRSLAGPTAPAHGLYLNRVFYGTEAT